MPLRAATPCTARAVRCCQVLPTGKPGWRESRHLARLQIQSRGFNQAKQEQEFDELDKKAETDDSVKAELSMRKKKAKEEA